ncbi:hypothetical protein BH10ACT1_BH10ACT1_04680 [soil metagenome]
MSIADAKYVSFTTYRRNGDAVSSAVWIAPLPDGRAAFTTAAGSGKTKRLAHTPAVALKPSDVKGRVAEGASATDGTAVVVEGGPDYDLAVKALRKKYGLQFTAVHLGSSIKARFGRGDHTAVIVSFGAARS